MTDKLFLPLLETRLNESNKDALYPCIRDLLMHGLDLARFSDTERKPQRQDITQYLAAWSRHAGLNEDESENWLIEYCVVMLGSLSKRTAAAIRHSTKSNIRSIYRAEVPFLCQCDTNPFRAECSSVCPVHADMQAMLQAKAAEALIVKPYIRPAAPVFEERAVKKVNLQQFQAGQSLILEEIQKGTKLQQIVDLLNERGLKSKTGKEWKYGLVSLEVKKLQLAASQSSLDTPVVA